MLYRFSLLGISKKVIQKASFSFFLARPRQLEGDSYAFQLSSKDIELMNPNTLTSPVFRCKADANLTKKIYFENEIILSENSSIENSHDIKITRMFDLNKSRSLFNNTHSIDNKSKEKYLPLVNGKLFDAFDHRYGSPDIFAEGGTSVENTTIEQHQNTGYVPNRFLCVDENKVDNWSNGRLNRRWMLALRNITNGTNHRTVISTILPDVATDYSVRIVMFEEFNAIYAACLLGLFNSLVFDYIVRQKISGLNLSDYITYQIAVPTKGQLLQSQEYIIPKIIELVYTAWDMQPFAQDMGYEGAPFIWNPARRALLRAELDAKYAKLYGLTRDELRYILDPSNIYGPEFPSETFRVLKNKELKEHGEYRTQRLVLAAWDLLESGSQLPSEVRLIEDYQMIVVPGDHPVVDLKTV